MKLRNFLGRLFVSLLAVLLICAGNAFGQSSNGSVVGTVTDKTGGAVANATVKVVSIDRQGKIRLSRKEAIGQKVSE